jgi:hypothetical protein
VFNLNEQAPMVAINIDMIPKQGKNKRVRQATLGGV